MTEAPQRTGSCPRCRAPYDATQEYCLECGARLPAAGAAAAAAALGRRVPSAVRGWLAPVLTAVAIAAAMTGIAILVARGTDPEEPTVLVATTSPASVTTAEIEPPPTTTAETEPESAPTTTAATPRPRRTLVEWPPSENGYTVVIASLPAAAGRARAVRKAREALGSGLRDVGVLDSAEFSSLHPGYYVVFSGIYDDQRDAVRAAPRVQDLYPVAYIREISR